jgi:hypothetical protein
MSSLIFDFTTSRFLPGESTAIYSLLINFGTLAFTFHQFYSQFRKQVVVASEAEEVAPQVQPSPQHRASLSPTLRRLTRKQNNAAQSNYGTTSNAVSVSSRKIFPIRSILKVILGLLFLSANLFLMISAWMDQDQARINTLLTTNIFLLFVLSFRVNEESKVSRSSNFVRLVSVLVVICQSIAHIALLFKTDASISRAMLASGIGIACTILVNMIKLRSANLQRFFQFAMLVAFGFHSPSSLWAVCLMLMMQSVRWIAYKRVESNKTILPSLFNVVVAKVSPTPSPKAVNQESKSIDEEQPQKRMKSYRVSQDLVEKRKEREIAFLKKKSESGKFLSSYEMRISGTQSSSPKELHSSMLSEKPGSIRKLKDTHDDSMKDVMEVLKRKHERDAEIIRQTTLEPILDEIKIGGASMLEFKHNNSFFFSNLYRNCANSDRIEKPRELVAALAENCPNLELIQMFSSSLEDSFLLALIEELRAGKFPKLQEIHLENNLFTGKSMQPFFEAMAQGASFAPHLNSIKLANQKSKDTTAEALALEALKQNPTINRLTYDFARFININEANTLLSKNGSVAKAKGKTLLSRSSSNSSSSRSLISGSPSLT